MAGHSDLQMCTKLSRDVQLEIFRWSKQFDQVFFYYTFPQSIRSISVLSLSLSFPVSLLKLRALWRVTGGIKSKFDTRLHLIQKFQVCHVIPACEKMSVAPPLKYCLSSSFSTFHNNINRAKMSSQLQTVKKQQSKLLPIV